MRDTKQDTEVTGDHPVSVHTTTKHCMRSHTAVTLACKAVHVRVEQSSKANPTKTERTTPAMKFSSVKTKAWELCLRVIGFNP